MSEMARQAREQSRLKAERLTRKPAGDVDGSGWREPLGEKGMIQTGPRPVSRQHFKSGGKVAGLAGVRHAGRKPRASGGKALINDWVNSNVKDANESRAGEKHDGGMARGGHADAAQDKKLIRAEMHKSGCSCAKCSGGRVGKAGGGSLDGKLQGMRPEGGRLARKGGGRAKKGMNVNIIIAPNSPPTPGAMPPPGGPPPGPGGGPLGMHQGAPPPMPPGAAPAGAPPPMMPRKAGGRATHKLAKPGAYPIENASGGGLGRLEKIKAYGATPTK
jgi:hypothetical protein